VTTTPSSNVPTPSPQCHQQRPSLTSPSTFNAQFKLDGDTDGVFLRSWGSVAGVLVVEEVLAPHEAPTVNVGAEHPDMDVLKHVNVCLSRNQTRVIIDIQVGSNQIYFLRSTEYCFSRIRQIIHSRNTPLRLSKSPSDSQHGISSREPTISTLCRHYYPCSSIGSVN
jgi:hypothetical protein